MTAVTPFKIKLDALLTMTILATTRVSNNELPSVLAIFVVLSI